MEKTQRDYKRSPRTCTFILMAFSSKCHVCTLKSFNVFPFLLEFLFLWMLGKGCVILLPVPPTTLIQSYKRTPNIFTLVQKVKIS